MNSENLLNLEPATDLEAKCITLESLASQFMEEHRRWMNPSIDKYAVDYPEHAEEIKESFPILIAMEQWKGNREFSRFQYQLPDPKSITQLGDCQIIRELARSKTSILYAAVQGSSNRRVAVKLLPWKSEMTPRWRERFERESRLVSRLRHENIVSFYRTGEDQGYFYSVMQRIDGVSLNLLIRQLVNQDEKKGSLTGSHYEDDRIQKIIQLFKQDKWNQFAKIGLQAAKALSYAHNRQTLHNDLQSDNLIIDSNGHTWVNNFRLAQVAEGTLKQQNARTLSYKAPERFKGQLNKQCDLYSLGMILYELAALRSAYQSQSSTEIVDHILNLSPERPRNLNKNIPLDFETIILNCIARSPKQRYQSAEELSMDLVRFLNGDPIKRRDTPKNFFKSGWFSARNIVPEQQNSE